VQCRGDGARYPRQPRWPAAARALARAIVFQPRLLLMDEPTGRARQATARELQLEMRRLHADLGITFIYVTHDRKKRSPCPTASRHE